VLSLPEHLRKTVKSLSLDVKKYQVVLAVALNFNAVSTYVIIDFLTLEHLVTGKTGIIARRS
jgi:hypothetical protein